MAVDSRLTGIGLPGNGPGRLVVATDCGVALVVGFIVTKMNASMLAGVW